MEGEGGERPSGGEELSAPSMTEYSLCANLAAVGRGEETEREGAGGVEAVILRFF